MKRIICLAAVVVALAFAGSANAGTSTNNMFVTANVVSECTFSVPMINFGNVTATAGSAASTQITMTCNSGAAYTITMDAGANLLVGSRNLKDGLGNTIAYNITKPDATQWGDSGYGNTFSIGTGYIVPVSTGTEYITVNASISAVGSAPPVGTYTDTVVVVANF